MCLQLSSEILNWGYVYLPGVSLLDLEPCLSVLKAPHLVKRVVCNPCFQVLFSIYFLTYYELAFAPPSQVIAKSNRKVCNFIQLDFQILLISFALKILNLICFHDPLAFGFFCIPLSIFILRYTWVGSTKAHFYLLPAFKVWNCDFGSEKWGELATQVLGQSNTNIQNCEK